MLDILTFVPVNSRTGERNNSDQQTLPIIQQDPLPPVLDLWLSTNYFLNEAPKIAFMPSILSKAFSGEL